MKILVLLVSFSVLLFAGNSENGLHALKSGDYKSAMAYFKMAAKRGDMIAMQNLGVMYNEGLGVAKNHNQASYWFNHASEIKASYKVAWK